MAISYHIYRNDGQGGPIDYDHPVATVSPSSANPDAKLALTLGPLARPSDNLFAVRAYDDASGIEEANTDARVRLILDAAGVDVSAQPNAVAGLMARWSAGDMALVSWGYQAAGQGGPPTRFDVFVGPSGATAPRAADDPPVASIPFRPGVAGFQCRLPGLVGTSAWTVQVCAIGETGILGPSISTPLQAQSGTLATVDALQAVACP